MQRVAFPALGLPQILVKNEDAFTLLLLLFSVDHPRPLQTIVARLPQAMMEPGENWLEETFQRHLESPLVPGWELPLDWTTPDVSGDKKVWSKQSSKGFHRGEEEREEGSAPLLQA